MIRVNRSVPGSRMVEIVKRVATIKPRPTDPVPPLDTPTGAVSGTPSTALGDWYLRYSDLVGRRPRVGEGDFATIFGKERLRVADALARGEVSALEAAYGATARCLHRRGVPLSELILVAAADPDESRPAARSNALESARTRSYARIYHTGERSSLPICTGDMASTSAPVPDHRPAATRYGIVGESRVVREVVSRIEIAAHGPRNTLILGESGTGKELVARGVHAASGAPREKFVAMNCAALSPSLAESELFGHARGAYTGASGEYAGLIRAADGGTLFLDEITEMSPELQAKLLRFLEERVVRPVGSLREAAVDVRVIASSNREIPTAIAQGRLRSDLYYRLQSFCIQLPPLRDHADDVPLLVEHFLATFCSRRCGCIWGVEADAMTALCEDLWPGNVRELQNVVETVVSCGGSGWIRRVDLPPRFQRSTADPEPEAHIREFPTLEETEIQLVRRALSHCNGNKVQVARVLGISRHKLYGMLRRET